MNRKIILASRPEGMPTASDFEMIEEEIPDLNEDQVLVKVQWISIDPAIRIWISTNKSYLPPLEIGETVRSIGLGTVVESRSRLFRSGYQVTGMLGWQEFSVMSPSKLTKLPKTSKPSLYLGVLGLTGISAYFAVFDMANPQEKDTMVVSAAAGAVGSVACELGKLKGCKVVGITGSDKKARWLMEDLKLDGVINYKESSVDAELKILCPEGVDIFIDNVGGEILDEVLLHIRKNSKIILCGSISAYNSSERAEISNYSEVLFKSASVRGFVMFDYAKEYWTAVYDLSKWLKRGVLREREHIIFGLESAPSALKLLFTGENEGKLLVRLMPFAPNL